MGARAGLSDKENTPAVGEVDGALLRADRGGGGGAERFARGSALLQLNAEGGHFGFHLPREPAADQVGRRGVHPARAGDLQHGVAAARIQFEHLRVFGFDAPREPRAGQVEQVRFPFLVPGGAKSLGAANRSRGGAAANACRTPRRSRGGRRRTHRRGSVGGCGGWRCASGLGHQPTAERAARGIRFELMDGFGEAREDVWGDIRGFRMRES